MRINKTKGFMSGVDLKNLLETDPRKEIYVSIYNDEESKNLKITPEEFLKRAKIITIKKPVSDFIKRESCIYMTYLTLYPEYEAILRASAKLYTSEPSNILEVSHPFVEKFRKITSNYQEPLNIETTAYVKISKSGKIKIKKPKTVKYNLGEFTGISAASKYSLNDEFEKLRGDFLKTFDELMKYKTKSKQNLSIYVHGLRPKSVITNVSTQ